MTYTLDFNIALGSLQTGLTLEAQLVDTVGANVGSAITTGFTEIGLGNYLWHTTAVPDGHRGGVKFQLSPGGVLKAFAAVNPEEAENLDSLITKMLVNHDVLAELAAAAPAATPTPAAALMLFYMTLRNKLKTITGFQQYHNDAGTVIAKSAVGDVAGVFTRGEMTGP